MERSYLGEALSRQVIRISRARRLGQSFSIQRTENLIDYYQGLLDTMDGEIQNRTQVSRENRFLIERNALRRAISALRRHLFRLGALRGQGSVFSRPRRNRIEPAPAPPPVSRLAPRFPVLPNPIMTRPEPIENPLPIREVSSRPISIPTRDIPTPFGIATVSYDEIPLEIEEVYPRSIREVNSDIVEY